MHEETASNLNETMELLKRGAKNRHIGSTNMNIESSRSHSVFSLCVQTKTNEQGMWKVRKSHFHFVDLAGSERQKQTESTGDRLKEGCNINRSLSVLGTVINSLVECSQGKKVHIGYRDSKLTFLLRDSLGGNSKTAMIANISSASSTYHETASTLEFAKRAKQIKNKAVLNEDASGDVEALRREVKRLQEELEAARAIVQSIDPAQLTSDSAELFSRSCSRRDVAAQRESLKNQELEALLHESMTLLHDSQIELQGEVAKKHSNLQVFCRVMGEYQKQELHYKSIITLLSDKLSRHLDLQSICGELIRMAAKSGSLYTSAFREIEQLLKLVIQERDFYRDQCQNAPLLWTTFKENILMQSRLSDLEGLNTQHPGKANVLPYIQRVIHHLALSDSQAKTRSSPENAKPSKSSAETDKLQREVQELKLATADRDLQIEALHQQMHILRSMAESEKCNCEKLKQELRKAEEDRDTAIRSLEYTKSQVKLNRPPHSNPIGTSSGDHESAASDHVKKIKTLQTIIAEMQEQIEAKDVMLQDTEHHRDKLSTELNETRHQKGIISAQLDVEKLRSKQQFEERSKLEKDKLRLERALGDERCTSTSLKSLLEKKEKEISRLVEQNSLSMSEIERKRSDISQFKARVASQLEKMEDMRAKYNEMVRERNKYMLQYNSYYNSCIEIINTLDTRDVQSIVHDIIHTNVYKQQVVVLQQTIEDSRYKMQELTLHIEDMYGQYVSDIGLYNKCIRELERDQKLAGLTVSGTSSAEDEKENIRGQRTAVFKPNNSSQNTSTTGGWQEDHCIGKRIDNIADATIN